MREWELQHGERLSERIAQLDCLFRLLTVDERVDVWSLGCTAYVLAFGDNPFESPVEGVKRLAILNGSFTMPAHGKHPLPRFRTTEYSKEYLDLIRMMLVVDLAPELLRDVERPPRLDDVVDHVDLLRARLSAGRRPVAASGRRRPPSGWPHARSPYVPCAKPPSTTGTHHTGQAVQVI